MGRYGSATSRWRRRVAIGAGLAALGTLAATGVAQAEPDSDRDVPCLVGVRACVDLDEEQAWLLGPDGSVQRGPVDISGGDEEDPTPIGTFAVEWKHRDHWSQEFDSDMPYSVFFAPGGIAFHEGELDSSSMGCVRLEEDDARAFFDSLQVGDRVQVT